MLDDIEKLASSYNGDLSNGHFKFPCYIELIYEIIKSNHRIQDIKTALSRDVYMEKYMFVSKQRKYLRIICNCAQKLNVIGIKSRILDISKQLCVNGVFDLILYICLRRIKRVDENIYFRAVKQDVPFTVWCEYIEIN